MSYEKWSFRYNLLKQYVRFVDWVIHQRILIQGKENIPGNKPLVFAPNHQNALSDPMAVLLNVKHQLVWLARADIFGKSKMVDGILRFMKIMPVYRMRDGMDSSEKMKRPSTPPSECCKTMPHWPFSRRRPTPLNARLKPIKRPSPVLCSWPKSVLEASSTFKSFPQASTTVTIGNSTAPLFLISDRP